MNTSPGPVATSYISCICMIGLWAPVNLKRLRHHDDECHFRTMSLACHPRHPICVHVNRMPVHKQTHRVYVVVDLAEFVCGEGPQTVPIEERITDVASAMAEAVAEVVGTCTGQGNAVASISGFSRAETRAEAVGRASARVLTTSEVCGRCTAALESLVETVETVSATAVAEASISVRHLHQLHICTSADTAANCASDTAVGSSVGRSGPTS